ncbi:MAG TPA: alpha/beta fold hydrolase [Steroidobacteraceae bacterium]|nr:alpha/beta fold hydrolase [Steroidobacteraceae bacterium]
MNGALSGSQAAAAAPEPVTLTASDGRTLAGLYCASAAAHGALVVNGATGFPHEFYRKFADYCAARGYHTLLYDYRGMGASASLPHAAETARMSDWGRLDMPAALGWLAARCPRLPLVTVGHSVGGQLIGCMPNQAAARAHVMVATSVGYWRWHRVPLRGVALLFWKIYGPLELRLRGYVPRGTLWRGDALPPGVFLEWRKWCLSPEHFAPDLAGDPRDGPFAAVRAPILSSSFSDDPIATPRAVEALLALYPNARIERRWTTPAAAGVRAIGHHGFFAERHRETLWRETLDWIDARLS